MMEIDVTRTLLVIAVCTVCTFAERALPFFIFRGQEIPKIVQYLGRILPMAIMATLLIYTIKGITFTTTGGWLPYLIGIAVTAFLHLWKSNTLLSIAGGTICYMLLVQFVFV